jgi:hypothetical protein
LTVAPIRPALGANGVPLPASVDLTQWDVPVGNQGQVASCVSWSIDYAMLGWYSNHDRHLDQRFHPMYTFSQTHVDNSASGGGSYEENTVDANGVLHPGALNVALTQGNDTAAHYHTQSTTDFLTKPTASDLANAAGYKIAAFRRLFVNQGAGPDGQAAIQTELANGRPVTIGMRVPASFRAPMYYKTDWASATFDDTTGGGGGHEMLAVGYDSTGLWVQNSWGTAWGFKGYARLTWRVVQQLVDSAYVIDGFAADTGSTTTTDTTAPTMGAVSQQFPLDQAITSTTVPVTFSWSASDLGGIAAYAVYVRTDAGRYLYASAVGATATTFTFALGVGHAYQVAVAAKDNAGNWSSYSYSARVTPGLADDSTFSIGGPWQRYSLSGALGDTYIGASDAGAYVTKTFIGTDVALIAVKGTNAGRATIYCDESSTAVGDFYSASIVTRQVTAYCHFQESGQHTMRVVNEGTSGRPSLFVDAFAVLQ